MRAQFQIYGEGLGQNWKYFDWNTLNSYQWMTNSNKMYLYTGQFSLAIF